MIQNWFAVLARKLAVSADQLSLSEDLSSITALVQESQAAASQEQKWLVQARNGERFEAVVLGLIPDVMTRWSKTDGRLSDTSVLGKVAFQARSEAEDFCWVLGKDPSVSTAQLRAPDGSDGGGMDWLLYYLSESDTAYKHKFRERDFLY